MTTTLLLLCGAGIGALIATIILLIVMARMTRYTKDQNAETVRLMKERNDIDREKVAHLKRLADTTEERNA